MFRRNFIKELLLYPQNGGNKSDLMITQEEFDKFYKEYLFDQLKDLSLGEAFCKKFNEENYVLQIIDNNEFAKKHIETYYIKK